MARFLTGEIGAPPAIHWRIPYLQVVFRTNKKPLVLTESFTLDFRARRIVVEETNQISRIDDRPGSG